MPFRQKRGSARAAIPVFASAGLFQAKPEAVVIKIKNFRCPENAPEDKRKKPVCIRACPFECRSTSPLKVGFNWCALYALSKAGGEIIKCTD